MREVRPYPFPRSHFRSSERLEPGLHQVGGKYLEGEQLLGTKVVVEGAFLRTPAASVASLTPQA